MSFHFMSFICRVFAMTLLINHVFVTHLQGGAEDQGLPVDMIDKAFSVAQSQQNELDAKLKILTDIKADKVVIHSFAEDNFDEFMALFIVATVKVDDHAQNRLSKSFISHFPNEASWNSIKCMQLVLGLTNDGFWITMDANTDWSLPLKRSICRYYRSDQEANNQRLDYQVIANLYVQFFEIEELIRVRHKGGKTGSNVNVPKAFKRDRLKVSGSVASF